MNRLILDSRLSAWSMMISDDRGLCIFLHKISGVQTSNSLSSSALQRLTGTSASLFRKAISPICSTLQSCERTSTPSYVLKIFTLPERIYIWRYRNRLVYNKLTLFIGQNLLLRICSVSFFIVSFHLQIMSPDFSWIHTSHLAERLLPGYPLDPFVMAQEGYFSSFDRRTRTTHDIGFIHNAIEISDSKSSSQPASNIQARLQRRSLRIDVSLFLGPAAKGYKRSSSR